MTNLPNKGLFITFEGGEGAGKTTLIDKIEQELKNRGVPVVRTREPGGTKLSEQIRHWLLDKSFDITVGDKAEMLLFLSARAQHLEELILPALAQGKVVLCDRFNDSTVVYQGVARGLGFDYVQKLCTLACGIEPDLTLFLDLDPRIGLARTRRTHKDTAKAGEMDRIESEKLEFHEKVRQGFLKLAASNTQRIHVLDATQSRDDVFSHALEILTPHFSVKSN